MDNDITFEANETSNVISECMASKNKEVYAIDLEAEERRHYGVKFNDIAKTHKLYYLIKDYFCFTKKHPFSIHSEKLQQEFVKAAKMKPPC